VAAGITDADGLTGVVFHYRWQHSANGGGGAFNNVASATDSADFTPTQAEVNRALRVIITYTDNHGTLETVLSNPTIVTGDLFVGGPGADTFNGTAGEDHAFGNGGNDTLNGNAGNDILVGGPGNDTINGGTGDDTIQVAGAGDGFDNVNGGTGNDVITATAANTTVGLTAITAIEQITDGGFGGLHISGDNNANTLNFSTVTLTNVVDINGGGGNDNLTGSAGSDVILGGAGNDTIAGGTGNDIITGGAGDDTLNGGNDDDLFLYAGTGEGFDAVTGGAGTLDRLEATAANTNIGLRSITQIEFILGNGFANVQIVGSAAGDVLNFTGVTITGVTGIDGAGGADLITGSAAAEIITGGAGNDIITPAGGNDRVRFTAGFGADTIIGFDSNPAGGQDMLDISSLGITAATFNAQVNIAAGPGGSTRITIGGNTITLTGVAPATVTAADFNLAGAPLPPLALVSGGVSTATATGARLDVLASQLAIPSPVGEQIRARFVFAPRGKAMHGVKTIVKAHSAKGRTVLRVLAKGNAKHGYKLRVVSGGKHSAWLAVHGGRVALVAVTHAGSRPSLIRTHR
jgi:Ca2+-binding RTX toxin-like protein